MRDDAGAEPPEDRRSKMVVRVVMREDDPFHQLLCHGLDRAEKALRLARTRQRVDHDDA
jgi:hypothetical protein